MKKTPINGNFSSMRNALLDNIEITFVRKEEQTVGTWAGGTTTQLAIWPPESDYQKRDFMWRLSTAQVGLEESVFTSLPGYHRLLMILEGSVRLVHETPAGRRETALNAFEQDAFEGGWKTSSRGRCVDYNLMMAAGCTGVVEALKSSMGTFDFFAPLAEDCIEDGTCLTEAFYCLCSGVRARAEVEMEIFEATLERGDFLMFSTREKNFRVAFSNLGEKGVWGVRAGISCRL